MHNIRFLLPVPILLWKRGFNSPVGSKPATIQQTILLHPQHENQHQKWPKKYTLKYKNNWVHCIVLLQTMNRYSGNATT